MARWSGESGVELSKTMLPQEYGTCQGTFEEIWKWLRENEIAGGGANQFRAR
jgi:hypothetical protein